MLMAATLQVEWNGRNSSEPLFFSALRADLGHSFSVFLAGARARVVGKALKETAHASLELSDGGCHLATPNEAQADRWA
jgi:hypothetical protein